LSAFPLEVIGDWPSIRKPVAAPAPVNGGALAAPAALHSRQLFAPGPAVAERTRSSSAPQRISRVASEISTLVSTLFGSKPGFNRLQPHQALNHQPEPNQQH